MGIGLLIIFGLGLIATPIALNITNHAIGSISTIIMIGSGLGLLFLAGILIAIMKLYTNTKASEAFVRTGRSSSRVVKDGAAFVIPRIHKVVWVSLQTLRLQVSREGEGALITKDKLRADIQAEFFVRVMPDDASILAAARSFGEITDPRRVTTLIEDKLVNALRTVAARKTLEELNSDRESFVKEVAEIVTPDLKHNGLTLEVATISKLDQTDPKFLRPTTNLFDAEGAATIAKTVQAKQTEKNKMEREGEQARKEQDVSTKKRILELEQEQAKATAEQAANVAIVTAAQDRAAKQSQIEAAQAVALREVEKAKATEVAARLQQQAVEVAEREKAAAIANAEALRAAADQKRADAEALAEKARQGVTTVTVLADAERKGQQAVINAKAEAEKAFVSQQRAADAGAYAEQKKAEGRKAAADADAEATTKKAQAESRAAELRATGATAEAMVPVNVQRAEVEVAKAQVDVKQRGVEVLTQELQARAEHGEVAQQFELAQLRITKEAEVRIATAQATATLAGKITATVVSTPEDVGKLMQSFTRGLGIARTAEGFLDGAGPETTAAAAGVLGMLQDLVGAAAKRVAGDKQPADVPPAVPPASTEKPAPAPVSK
jgi:flotillin